MHDDIVAADPNGRWELPVLDFKDLEDVFKTTLKEVKAARSDREVYGQKIPQGALMFADDAHYHLPGLLLPSNLKKWQKSGHLGVC